MSSRVVAPALDKGGGEQRRAGGDVGQVASTLLRRAERVERQGAAQHGLEQRHRRDVGTDLLEQQSQLGEARATATDVLLQARAHDAGVGQLPPQVLVEPPAITFQRGEPGRGRALGEDACGELDEGALVLGRVEVHRRPYRGARGIASPTIEMMSRWISLVPPPKVSTSVLRIARSRSAPSSAPAESLVSVEAWPRISMRAR